ncbi:putative inorganic phosphate transporter 1-4 [Platanthera zijinensis]|uniref:Inorganic phosphate transporter 1-4 n=1 Tax=Platanthera zijinensis TaxID=2320716 RepID=A0AAP0G9N5_9ASPA
MQGFRNLAGGIVTIIISVVFKGEFEAPNYKDDPASSTVSQADFVWRIILMFCAAPAVLTYYRRAKMPERGPLSSSQETKTGGQRAAEPSENNEGVGDHFGNSILGPGRRRL